MMLGSHRRRLSLQTAAGPNFALASSSDLVGRHVLRMPRGARPRSASCVRARERRRRRRNEPLAVPVNCVDRCERAHHAPAGAQDVETLPSASATETQATATRYTLYSRAAHGRVKTRLSDAVDDLGGGASTPHVEKVASVGARTRTKDLGEPESPKSEGIHQARNLVLLAQ